MNDHLMRAAYDDGVNLFGTGRSFTNGQNEITRGRSMKDARLQAIIQSRLQIQQPDRLKDTDQAADVVREIEQSVTESLKVFQTDFVDIRLFH